MPQEAVTISFGVESLIQFESSAAENPPNTTEWIAPIRADASIAKPASGIIGM